MQTTVAATREAFGPTLISLARQGLDIVVLDADLGASTSAISFGREYPERFFTVGIAEQDMIGIAAGLAAEGKQVFASTFASFMPGRCYDQIRVSVAYPRLNVKLVSSHGGIVTGEDGFSAQATEDLALMCSLPNFHVLVPADVVEAGQAMEAAARTPGPFYIRCQRPKTPIIYDESHRFQLGQADVLRQGADATIIATGVTVHLALEAATGLTSYGVDCRVLNMSTLKPLDEQAIARAARETGAIVTVEDHQVRIGLSSMVGQVLAINHPAPMESLGMNSQFGESGRWDELLAHFGLTPERIVQAVKTVLARKPGR